MIERIEWLFILLDIYLHHIYLYNGTAIFTIQKLMDHANIEQTLRYAKLAPDSSKENLEFLYN